MRVCKSFQEIYVDYLGSSFPNKCVNFKAHIKNLKVNEKPKDILEMLDVYPHIVIALRIVCTSCNNYSIEYNFTSKIVVKVIVY